MSEIEAIIFDLGGTLIEYAGPYATWPALETPGFEAAYAHLSGNGITLPPFDAFRETGFVMLPGRWQAAARSERNLRLVELLGDVLAEHDITADSDALTQAATLYEDAICAQAHPLDGAADILAWVRGQGFKVGLLSNTMFTGRAHVRDLERFGLAGYFDAMLFSADAGKWKPTPAPFLQVVADLGVTPETAVYIGDDPRSDIAGGQSAGLRTIHIRSSQRFELPPELRPDATIHKLADLPAVLDAWNGGS